MSVQCRDWLKTLWPASYKGVPFFFESDKEKGGRDNVKHVFPHRDAPFIEDMGEALRFFSGSAYVHGDNADALANALKSALTTQGPGMLVVPYFGPVTVHCETFERSTQRDQMGYVAFELKFVRAGASSALISIPLLQNVAFTSADTAASAIATMFPAMISTSGQPDYVVSAVTDTLSQVAATVDVLRTTYPTDPTASASIRDAVQDFVAALPDQVSNVSTPADAAAAMGSLVSIVRQLGDGLDPASAVSAAMDLINAFPSSAAAQAVTVAGKPYLSPTVIAAAANVAAAARAARLAALTVYAEAVLRTTFASRPDGVTARAQVAERFENELLDTTGAASAALFVAIEQLQAKVIEWLTQTITTLAPIVIVESARIRPSLALAWILYADPTRSDELVARNNVRHPSFMPRTIEALAK